MGEEQERSFLARWSRRKLAAAGAAGQAEPAVETEAERQQPAEPPSLPELPDIETLGQGSDFRPFLQAGVPAELRRTALRRLWRVNPIISTPDGLDDWYVTADLTDAATVVPGLRTAYRVGRGMVEALEEAAPCPEPDAVLETLDDGEQGLCHTRSAAGQVEERSGDDHGRGSGDDDRRA